MSAMKAVIKPLLLGLVSVGASSCARVPSDNQVASTNVRYWHKGSDVCFTMAGTPYCFPESQIDARALETDGAAGLLVMVPIADKEISSCNENHWKLNSSKFYYPHIQLNVQETPGREPIQIYYDRIESLKVGKDSELVFPRQKKIYYGMDCYLLENNSTLHREMMCHGGEFINNEPVFFFSCARDGGVPNPGCRDDFIYRNIVYGVTYNKHCAAYNYRIRRLMIDYVAAARVRGEA